MNETLKFRSVDRVGKYNFSVKNNGERKMLDKVNSTCLEELYALGFFLRQYYLRIHT